MTTSTTTFEGTSSRAGSERYPSASLRFHWIYTVLCGWLVGGLFLDGWAHTHGRVDDVFFTPWHGVLYGGVAAMMLFLFLNLWRNMDKGFPIRQALPQGYWLSLVGVGLFLVGGGFDFVWHTLFGVEVNIEGLLSPSHLFLATSGFLIATGPIRAGWRGTSALAGWKTLGPVIVCATILLSFLTFFTNYASPIVNTFAASENVPDTVIYSDLYIMNADGSGQTRLTTGSDQISWFGVWSPDGSQIVFTRSDPAALDESALYLINADGSGLSQLTDLPGWEYVPTWSPDGSRVAFVSSTDGNTDIFAINSDGTNPVNLTQTDAPDYGPAWSPDGQHIVYTTSPSGNDELYLMDADGGNQTLLVSDGQYNWGASWSPDGGKIAFNSVREGNTDIYVVNADGTGASRLTDDPGNDYSPAWSPDGAQITFTSWRDGDTDVYRMNADGSDVTNLSDNRSLSSEFPKWSPDGSKILYTASEHFRGDNSFYMEGLGVASILVLSALMMGIVLVLVRRWRLPFGALTLLMTANALLMAVLSDRYVLALFAIPAGLVADVLLLRLCPSIERAGAFYSFAFLAPATYFACYFLALQLTIGIGWTIHLWLGGIFIAGIVGLFLALVLLWPLTSETQVKSVL